MPQLRTSLQELTANPAYIANNVQYDAVDKKPSINLSLPLFDKKSHDKR